MLTACIAVVGIFVLVSNSLVDELAVQERQRMQIWADATKEIVSAGIDTDIDFPLGIIRANRSIPVLLTDDDGNIINQRNFSLPEPADSLLSPAEMCHANREYLARQLEALKRSPNVIHITIAPNENQHLYYKDSRLLRALSYYPYAQLVLMAAFVAAVYFAVSSSRRAEQNKVWVGLTKETAHQLGTPISSLMAWTELLPGYGVDKEVVNEIAKDVSRLEQVASRFGKIGSRPTLEPTDLGALLLHITDYMRTRISGSIELRLDLPDSPLLINGSAPLLEWVMENLIRNAVDAIDAPGRIVIRLYTSQEGRVPMAVVDVTDTGRGMSRRDFKTVFKPGFTTKKRGWGLGLTLAARIVGQYHGGRIFVRWSTPGEGTTFAVELPLLVSPANNLTD